MYQVLTTVQQFNGSMFRSGRTVFGRCTEGPGRWWKVLEGDPAMDLLLVLDLCALRFTGTLG